VISFFRYTISPLKIHSFSEKKHSKKVKTSACEAILLIILIKYRTSYNY